MTSTVARTSDVVGARLRMFSVCWALAALFHLAGNPRPSFVDASVWRTGTAVALGMTAIALLLRPHDRRLLVLLCGLVPVSAWLEAPVVGNHWVLAAAVSLTVLTAAAFARLSGDRSPDGFWRRFAPTARLVLLTAYAFAAFAKLNSAFFDPSVSCAVYYQDQLVGSWGLGALSVSDSAFLGRASAVGAAVTELSVPLLLLLRRTRPYGLVLALSFHWMLALDLDQHFWDFTSVLFAVFLLFADDRVIDDLRHRRAFLIGAVRRPVRVALALAALPLAAVAVASASSQGGSTAAALGTLLGHVAWIAWGTTLLAVVAVPTLLRLVRRGDHGPDLTYEKQLRVPHPALLVLPLLVFANGLTPYLELKTGFGWNMYSNLRTVDGDSNHLLVRRTLPLSDAQSELVEIESSDDASLQDLAERGYAMVATEFEGFLARHPDVRVTYRRGGAVQTHEPTDGQQYPRPGVIEEKLQSYRPVATAEPEGCVTLFTPAR